MADTFTNWSGSLSCSPRHRVRATSTDEVVETIRRAAADGSTVRPLGSGHSSMPVMTTDDVMLSVDDLRGVVSVDEEAGIARVLPGTGLADLGAELAGQYIPDETLADTVVITDSVDELVGRLREFEQLGFERIYLHHVARNQRPFLDLAESELLRALHGT